MSVRSRTGTGVVAVALVVAAGAAGRSYTLRVGPGSAAMLTAARAG